MIYSSDSRIVAMVKPPTPKSFVFLGIPRDAVEAIREGHIVAFDMDAAFAKSADASSAVSRYLERHDMPDIQHVAILACQSDTVEQAIKRTLELLSPWT